MLARRAASALAAAAIARPAAACFAVFESFIGAGGAAISPAAHRSGGQAAAPHRLPPTGSRSSGSLLCSPGGALQPSTAQQLKLLRSFSRSGSLGERQRSKGSGNSSADCSSKDHSGRSEAQLQAAAERLMRLSRDGLTHPEFSTNTDESMQQRMVLLLRLGFSHTAIEKAIDRQAGGPYIAEQHVGEAVALMRRWGFSQKQLDGVLSGSGTFTREEADIEAVLVWLQREFGLQRSEVATACGHSPILLEYKQASLAANWQAFVKEFQPTADARRKLAAGLRQGEAHFLRLMIDTLRHKVAQLAQLFDLDSNSTSSYVGHLAALFRSDVDQTARPRFLFLQQLTGRPAASLAPIVLRYPSLLRYPEATLQRNYDAVLAAMGPADGRLLVQQRPSILAAAEGRVAANLRKPMG
ncbi:mTERF domain-containing mitochondrial [Chlorella sorokiniana]|uniref:mTERF domain-containing mitochondrial n=1 Tax=Chlorella sorokiniana TaxID=3076 RepID=A0A2P6TV57_CHLSO|nr:mTERF domain-containing mitochondrial [Chlorella sorokiniana]|eukprot:PRW57949.1 mTERF domain-containing mitochondrial [Chlorella sorokiniana]